MIATPSTVVREDASPVSDSDWMIALADQFRAMRHRYSEDALMIVFDIDGTILDMRYMIRHVLIDFDRAHNTDYFFGLEAEDIDVHENHVDRFLAGIPMPEIERRRIFDWYLEHRWRSDAVLASHRPYRGVMEVIRWFLLQPRTHIGLNTGRPEALREDTLRSLNSLGRAYRVEFHPDLLEMNRQGWEQGVADGKAAALHQFRARGYRVFAVVDNEPENIVHMLEADKEGEILFLHADTTFLSRSAGTPRTVRGRHYELARLIPEREIGERVTLVWHGVNDVGNLRQFLASPVYWCECDVRRDPRDRLVLRHDSFERTPWRRDEPCLMLDLLLSEIGNSGKAIKLDLKEGGEPLERVLECLGQQGFSDDRLWFNGEIGNIGQFDFRRLALVHPGAILQCSVDFLGPLAVAVPNEARRLIDMLREWGITRFSIAWRNQNRGALTDLIEGLGHEINLYGVSDLESFLRAALMLPRSLTADFNFPQWQYYGHGSGEGRAYHDYELHRAVPTCETGHGRQTGTEIGRCSGPHSISAIR